MADKYLGIYRSETRRVNWHGYNGGEYFVTICTKDRVHYFGEIANGEMQLSAIGQYTHEQFMNVATHYPYTKIPLWIVMPDHIHAIVIIDGKAAVADCNCTDAINRIATKFSSSHKYCHRHSPSRRHHRHTQSNDFEMLRHNYPRHKGKD